MQRNVDETGAASVLLRIIFGLPTEEMCFSSTQEKSGSPTPRYKIVKLKTVIFTNRVNNREEETVHVVPATVMLFASLDRPSHLTSVTFTSLCIFFYLPILPSLYIVHIYTVDTLTISVSIL